jgi:CheY-like chemotaxis protein
MGKFSNVLIVEDDPISQYLISEVVQQEHIADHIFTADNGENALDQLKNLCKTKSDCPDLILLDLNMPVMNGHEFLEKYFTRINKPRTRIYVLTSSTNPKDVQSVKRFPVDGYLIKPLTTETFKLIANYDKD